MPTVPDTHRDLLDAAVATLATIGPDGRPQLSAVWFVTDGDTFRLSLNATRQKMRNLAANPAATLLVMDPERTSRYLEVRGDARIEEDPDGGLAARVNAKYGTDVRVHDRPGEPRLAVTLVPARVRAVDMAAA